MSSNHFLFPRHHPTGLQSSVSQSGTCWLTQSAIVTGCSSGIGKAIANLIANKPGQRLVATARNINDLSYLPESKDILKLRLDVTDVKNVDDAFAKVKEVWGEYAYLDIVVCHTQIRKCSNSADSLRSGQQCRIFALRGY